jgi:uncharacterized membrane protein YoaK (UPF0700 family)
MGSLVWRQYRWHLVWFFAGVVVGVMFAHWLRSMVTLLVVAGVVFAMYFIWISFDNLKKQ